MTKASDNAFPSLLVVEGSAPAAPAAGDHRLYVDSADHLLKWKDSSSVVRLATGQPLGLTGAVSATRYVGGTASVAPTTGTFAVGDFVITAAGGMYICTVAGSPGTWVAVSGSGMTNPMTAVGDIIQGTTAGAPAVLAAPLAGKVLTGAGVTTPLAYVYPPGHEYDYVEFVAAVTITATTESGSTTIVTGSSVAYDGSTIVMIEFFAPNAEPYTAGIGALIVFTLFEDGVIVGIMGAARTPVSGTSWVAPIRLSLRKTPSNASHVYSVRAYRTVGNGTVTGQGGGTGTYIPGYIRITQV